MEKKDVLKVQNLVVYSAQQRRRKEIVKHLSFSLESGESLAIVGESGCGKTMTAMSLFQLLPEGCFAEGSALLNGRELLHGGDSAHLRGTDLVLIPQNGAEFLDPVFRVRSQMYETLKKVGVPKKQLEQRALELLRAAGFADPAKVLPQYPFELSGGMAQRVILAIGMAAHPKVVVADEPTRGIDRDGVENFIGLLGTVFSDTILMIITHNMQVARQCSKVLVMFDGEIMEYGPCRDILDHTTHPYSRSLLRDLPGDRDYLTLTRADREERPAGTGCPYYRRCQQARDRCGREHPPLVQGEQGLRRCFYAGSPELG